MKLLLVLISLLSFSSSYARSKHALIMGGGGEPRRDSTIFDHEIERVGNFISSSPQWKTAISFNGGHRKTENIIFQKFGVRGVRNTDFTPESYNKLVSDSIKKIEMGEIKSGDQLMVFINSHGGQKSPGLKTHTIATTRKTVTDFDRLNGGTVNLDALEKLTQLAQKKGIKLAIIDFSCHSGHTMNLRNKNTCVITSTGPNHYGYGGTPDTFTATFSGNMKKGKNLEEVFLESRKSFQDSSFPMISSPQGLELHREIYDSLTPFLYYYDDKYDKLSSFLESEALLDNPSCIEGDGVNALKKLSREAENFAAISLRSIMGEKDLQGFNQAVVAYHRELKELHQNLREMNIPLMKKREKFCSSSLPKECVEYSVENLLTLDFTKIKAHFLNNANQAKGQNRARYQSLVQVMGHAEKRKMEILAKNPKMKDYNDFFKKRPGLEKQTRRLANNVSQESQKLYYALYKQRSLKDNRSNPCKEFIL